ncbi:type IV pilin protein [Aquipuribacter sp. SD81]|uniref:type IV pilin protein n=1 Tax=Aquipuribacter sp. SD81 TaxID=3127703 RepID=UPI00301A3F47
MLARINKAMAKKDSGFTLIELLVVVIIIGILAAIAIPTFLNQRERAWSRAAQSDLRNAAVSAEEHFNDFGTYAASGTNTVLTNANDTEDVTLAATITTVDRYCLTATHANLPGRSFVLDSEIGTVGEVGVDGVVACA